MPKEDLRLWHGGKPGLSPGDLLLPPCETGVLTRVDLLTAAGIITPDWMDADRNRRDRVYLTRDRELARAYAYSWEWDQLGRGALYIARPVGPSWPDPDLLDHSIECERAEVVAVYDPAVQMSARRYQRIMLSQAK